MSASNSRSDEEDDLLCPNCARVIPARSRICSFCGSMVGTMGIDQDASSAGAEDSGEEEVILDNELDEVGELLLPPARITRRSGWEWLIGEEPAGAAIRIGVILLLGILLIGGSLSLFNKIGHDRSVARRDAVETRIREARNLVNAEQYRDALERLNQIRRDLIHEKYRFPSSWHTDQLDMIERLRVQVSIYAPGMEPP